MGSIVTRVKEVDFAERSAVKKWIRERGLSSGWASQYLYPYNLSIWSIIAAGGSDLKFNHLCRENTIIHISSSRWLHRRPRRCNHPEICTHGAVVSSTLPPSLSSLAGRCFAAFFSSKIGRPFSFTIARIHPTFIRIRGIFKKSLETHATFAFISIVSEFCKFEISKRKDVSFQKSSAFAKGLRNDCHHIFPKLSLL